MRNIKHLFSFELIICFRFYSVSCFYLTPVNYCEKAIGTCQPRVVLYVNRLCSEETLIPYEYNHFDFCPVDESDSPVENLGQVVLGERIRPSPYNISFLKNVDCALVCQKTYNLKNADDVEKINNLKKGMLKNYQHYWLVDNMPVLWCYQVDDNQQFCSTHFSMGCYVNSVGQPKDSCVINTMFNKPDTFYLFNHVDLTITYHSGEEEPWGIGFGDKGGRIIRIKVCPRSIKNSFEKGCSADTLPMDIPNEFKSDTTLSIDYTYSVKFVLSN